MKLTCFERHTTHHEEPKTTLAASGFACVEGCWTCSCWWKVVGRVVYFAWQRPATTRPATFHACKTKGCECSFRLLIIGGVSPETCWSSYKYEINVDTLLHLVGFLYELYYDARNHEHQNFRNMHLIPTSTFFSRGAATQRGSWPPHPWGFLDHTQPRTTVGRTTLDELSACHRDLYLTTHNTHNRQKSMPPVGFEPKIPTGERPQTYALDRAATGTSYIYIYVLIKSGD
jgi:hypothetical protein